MDTFRTEYNRLLQIHDKACLYFDDMTVPGNVREEKIPTFQKLAARMNSVMLMIQAQGHEMTNNETFNGFKD